MVVAVLSRALGVTQVGGGVEEEQVPVAGAVVVVVGVAVLTSKPGTVGWLVSCVGGTSSSCRSLRQRRFLFHAGSSAGVQRDLLFFLVGGVWVAPWLSCHGSCHWSGRLCR